jgi:NitT/TauT family transport system substrate-binding protein
MRRIAGLLALALTLVGVSACNSGAHSAAAGGGGRKGVKIATINLLTFSPVYVADKLGYFKAEGLNVTLIPTSGGAASAQAMLGGSVQAATTGFDTPISLTAKGQPCRSLVGMEMATIYAFVGGKKFPLVPADDPKAFVDAIKGKKFGVASAGSTGDVIARGLFSEYGLNPDKDVKVIPVGTGAAASAALQSGAVDALISYEPDVTKMATSGAGRVVFDLRNTKTETTYSQLPTSTLQATAKWIKDNPETAAALVRAVAKADDVLREQPDVALPVLKQLYPDLPPESVEGAYKVAQSHFKPAITQATYDSAMKVYKTAGTITADIPYSQTIGTQFSQYWK